MQFSKKISALMRRRGLTTRALGAAVDVSNGTVGGWLKGALPRPEVVKRLADFFGLSVEDLLDDTKVLTPDRTEHGYTEAHNDAALLQDPTAKETAFLRSIERTAHADLLRLHARRLLDQAHEMHQLADQIDPKGAEATEAATKYLEGLKKQVEESSNHPQQEGNRRAK